eukprot:scaffold940_cov569-Prasinococcus_capsulatus_cf.AAC.27
MALRHSKSDSVRFSSTLLKLFVLAFRLPGLVSVSTRQCSRSFVTMDTSRATCRAVSGASPVIIDTLCDDAVRERITGSESDLVLQANAAKPTNCKLLSAHSRGLLAAAAATLKSPVSDPSAEQGFDAKASTRMPCSASFMYVASYHAGLDPSASKPLIASGEPFTSTNAPLAPNREVDVEDGDRTHTIVAILCSLDENR